jgi:RNA polymerase sigma-70 factor, ECF subfamily
MDTPPPSHPAALREVEALILRVAQQDRAAFKTLYDRTAAKLFGICLRVLTDRAEAEDALQEVFVKVWDRADRYRANGLSPMTWLITVARNHAIDRLRARKSASIAGIDAAAEIADSAPGPEALAIAASDKGRIDACLGQLDPDKADAVRRAYLGGETYDDLAVRYSVPLNTIRTWLRRSLIKLRECLTA